MNFISGLYTEVKDMPLLPGFLGYLMRWISGFVLTRESGLEDKGPHLIKFEKDMSSKYTEEVGKLNFSSC